MESVSWIDDNGSVNVCSSSTKKLKRAGVIDSLPFDCWSYIVCFFKSPRDFLMLSLSVKGIYEYVLKYNPFCLRNIEWKIVTLPIKSVSHVANIKFNSDLKIPLNELSTKYPNLSSLRFVGGKRSGQLMFSKFMRLTKLDVRKSSPGVVTVGEMPLLENIAVLPMDYDENENLPESNVLHLNHLKVLKRLSVRRWKVLTEKNCLENLVRIHLEDVVLRTNHLEEDEKIEICNFQFLEYLVIYGKCNISKIEKLPALKCLRYRFSEYNSPRVLIEQIENLPELEHIEIHYAQVPIKDEFYRVERICNLPKLNSLFLRNTQAMGNSRKTALYNLPRLEHLYIHMSPFALLEPIPSILKSIRISVLPLDNPLKGTNHFEELSWILNATELRDLRLYIFPFRKGEGDVDVDVEDGRGRYDPLDSPKMRKLGFPSTPKRRNNWLLEFFERGRGYDLDHFTILDRRRNEDEIMRYASRVCRKNNGEEDHKFLPEEVASACFSGLFCPIYFLDSSSYYENLTVMDVYIETKIKESFEVIREACPSLVDFKLSIMKPPTKNGGGRCVIGELDFSSFEKLERLFLGANIVNHTQCQLFGDGFFFEESSEDFERNFKFLIEDDFITEVDEHNYDYVDSDDESDEYDILEPNVGVVNLASPTALISIGIIRLTGLENLDILHIDLSRLRRSLHVTRIHISDCHVRNAYVKCGSDLYFDNLPYLDDLTVINGTKSCELRNLVSLERYTMEINPIIRDTICNFNNLKELILFSRWNQKQVWCEVILQNLPSLEKVKLDKSPSRDVRVGLTVRNCQNFLMKFAEDKGRNNGKNRIYLIPDFLKEQEKSMFLRTGY